MFHDALREAVCKDYLSALDDLTFCSEYYISMLTKLAKDNLYFAKDIVSIMESHIAKAPANERLPVLYLVDSIVKNVKGHYLAEFDKNISIFFVSVFEKVGWDTRKTLCRLRNTWDDVFSLETLYALDMRVRRIDPNWPIRCVPPTADSSLSLTSSHLLPAADQLASTGTNTTEVRREQQRDEAPVKEDEESEPNPETRRADGARGDTAIVSELRSTCRAGELRREGAGTPPGRVHEKKRFCSASPLPSPLLSETEDSSAVAFPSSARHWKGERPPCRQPPLPAHVTEEKTDLAAIVKYVPLDKQFKPFEEDLSHVDSDPQCMMRFDCEPTSDNKKERALSVSAPPLFPPSKRTGRRLSDRSPDSVLLSPANSGDGTLANDSTQLANVADKTTSYSRKASDTQEVKRSLRGGASDFTSSACRSVWEELRGPSQVTLDPHLTGLSVPPYQHCPPEQYCPMGPQNHPMQGSPWRWDRVVTYASLSPHGVRTPADMFRDALQRRASFNWLPLAGAPNVSGSQQMPLTLFYNPGTMPPPTGHTNAPVPADGFRQGLNAWPDFGITRPTVPCFHQSQSFIAPAQNCVVLNQPGSQFESRTSHSGQMNVNSLLTRLISSGLIKPTATAQTQAAKTEQVSEKQKEDDVLSVPDLTGFVREHVKRRYEGVVSELYAGRQCFSCGERFGPTHTRQYRAHLDWHYQQNCAKKSSQARAAHRTWYCCEQDWIEHDDSPNLVKKAKKSRFFEQAQKEMIQGPGDKGKRDLHSVRAAVDVVNESCEICRELFDLTWEDDQEQWCLKNAIRSDGKTYHPSCYEDYKNAL